MLANAAPRPGDVYLRFNGLDNYVEIPSIADYSIATTGEFAVAAWIRPDSLNFPRLLSRSTRPSKPTLIGSPPFAAASATFGGPA